MQKLEMYTKNGCGYCVKAENLIQSLRLDRFVTLLENTDDNPSMRQEALDRTGGKAKTVPVIFVDNKWLEGGYEEFSSLVFTRDFVLNLLRNYELQVTFIKADGSERVMRCTLKPDVLPEFEDSEKPKKKIKENDEVIRVYVPDLSAWRSFRVDSLERYVILG